VINNETNKDKLCALKLDVLCYARYISALVTGKHKNELSFE